MFIVSLLVGCLAAMSSANDDPSKDFNATSLAVSGRGYHGFNEYGFPELVFGSHAAVIAAFTYYIVIFFKTFLLIHFALVRQREAENQWSARAYRDDGRHLSHYKY